MISPGKSAGTELSYVKGTNPHLSARWEAALGLFVPGEPTAAHPVTRLGYMEVGRVVAWRDRRVGGVDVTFILAGGPRTSEVGKVGGDVSRRMWQLAEFSHIDAAIVME